MIVIPGQQVTVCHWSLDIVSLTLECTGAGTDHWSTDPEQPGTGHTRTSQHGIDMSHSYSLNTSHSCTNHCHWCWSMVYSASTDHIPHSALCSTTLHLLECLGFDAGTRELKPNMTIDTQPGVAVHNSRPELKLNQDFHDAQWKRRLTCYLTVSSQYLFNGWLKYWLFSTGYFSRKVCKLKGRLRTHDCTKQTKVLLCTFLSVPGKFSVMKLAGYQQSTFLIFKEKNSAHMIHSS